MRSDFLTIKDSLPVLGVGLGYRRELAELTVENKHKIDWLEIVPENYMDLGGAARERLEHAIGSFPLVTHGINLSIGSSDELREDYLVALKKLLDLIDAPWWSDHLCFTSIDGKYLHDLLPLPFNREAVDHSVRRIKQAAGRIERPFLIENISFYMNMPGSTMSEAAFLSSVLEEADCGLLLDVNNVYVNSINHNYDPYKFIDSIPIERTVQIHIAGHSHTDEIILDSHGNAVVEPVFELLAYVLSKTKVQAIMLERDQNFPEFNELIGELDQMRQIAQSVQPELASPPHRQNQNASEPRYVLESRTDIASNDNKKKRKSDTKRLIASKASA